LFYFTTNEPNRSIYTSFMHQEPHKLSMQFGPRKIHALDKFRL